MEKIKNTSKVVPSGRQNTKYKTGRISCFVFCILSRDKTGPNDKIVSEFCLDFVFCLATKKRDKIENSDFKPILSSVDHYNRERHNTKYKKRNSSSFVFCILSTTRNDLIIVFLPTLFFTLNSTF